MKGSPLLMHIFIRTCPFCFAVTWCPSADSICLSISSNDPGIKSETYGVTWHVALESKIQLVNCELSQKFLLGHLSLPYIRAIDTYIFCSLLFFPLSHAKWPFSFKLICFRRFLFSFGGFFEILQLGDLEIHILKHFWCIRSVCLFLEWPAARAFSFSCLVLLKHFSAEWLTPPQKVHFVWTSCALSLFLPKPELLSIFI